MKIIIYLTNSWDFMQLLQHPFILPNNQGPLPRFLIFCRLMMSVPLLYRIRADICLHSLFILPLIYHNFLPHKWKKKSNNQLYFNFSGRFLLSWHFNYILSEAKTFPKKNQKTNLITNEVPISTHAFSPQTHEIRFFTSSYFLQFTSITEKLIFFSIHVFFLNV